MPLPTALCSARTTLRPTSLRPYCSRLASFSTLLPPGIVGGGLSRSRASADGSIASGRGWIGAGLKARLERSGLKEKTGTRTSTSATFIHQSRDFNTSARQRSGLLCAPRRGDQITHALSADASTFTTRQPTTFTTTPHRNQLRPSTTFSPSRPSALRASMASTQSRSASGHSHDHDHHDHSHSHGAFGHHHHHGPNTFLTGDKTDAGVRITRIGLLVNLLMAITKGLGGVVFSSQALIADAFHSLTDLVADFLTLGTVSFARKGPSERFPNGYGKVESLGSVGVSGLLLFGGLAMGYSSVLSLYAEFFVENAHEFLEAHAGHGHSHSHSHSHGPSLNAAWLALGSILVKEWLYRATMKVALARKSTVLASNAVHHRIDSLTSIVALLAIGASHVFKDATFFDPVGGLIVSLMVITAGWSNTRVAVMELVDVGLDEDIKSSVQSACAKAAATSAIPVQVRDVGGIKSGQNYLVDIALEVPGGSTIEKLGMLEREVREVVGSEVMGVKRIKVRFVPEGEKAISEFVDEETLERQGKRAEEKKEN